jgi:hypothetical protein
MSFVLDDRSRRQVEDPPEGVPDPVGDGRVVGGPVPD